MNPGRLRAGVDLRCLETSQIRGFARYTRALTTALATRTDLELIGYCSDPKAVEAPFEIDSMRAGSELLSEQMALPIWAARREIDVLWCPANRGLPLLSPVPTVLTLHDAVEWDASLVSPPSGWSRARFAYASVCSLASAVHIIVPSRAAASAINERLQVPWARMSVIHEAADPKFHLPPPESAVRAILRRYDLAPGFVLYVGGLDPKKDVGTLLRAIARLASKEIVTVVAGAADDAWTALATYGAGTRVVRIEGPTDEELRCLYASAACFVFPALAEGFGLPIVEAMAAGLPVVGANAGALPEVIGEGGQLFDPGNDIELAGLIRVLLSDDDHRGHWAARAAARGAEMSWEQAAETTAEVLRAAASGRDAATLFNSLRRLRSWRAWMPPQ